LTNDRSGASPKNPSLIGGVIGRVTPLVLRQIDMDAIVSELDVNAIAEQLDLDALMTRLDMDALVRQLDVNLIAEMLDLDALMTRLDMDALVDRLDVNAIAEMLDLDALMKKMDMAQLTAGVTQDVAVSGLDLARRQLVRADATVDAVVGRVLRRKPGDRPEAPARFVDGDARPVVDEQIDPTETRRRDVSGHYAGPVTRGLALAGDFFLAFSTYGIVGAVTLYFLGSVFGADVDIGSGGWLSVILAMCWLLAWFWIPVALFGRTPTMALVGLAVVRREGQVVGAGRALLRAVFVPISVAILLVGLIGLVVGKERRALFDVAGGTVTVYDWGERDAEQPVSIREQLSARVSRRKAVIASDSAEV